MKAGQWKPLIPEPRFDELEKKFVKVHVPKSGKREKLGVGGRFA